MVQVSKWRRSFFSDRTGHNGPGHEDRFMGDGLWLLPWSEDLSDQQPCRLLSRARRRVDDKEERFEADSSDFWLQYDGLVEVRKGSSMASNSEQPDRQ